MEEYPSGEGSTLEIANGEGTVKSRKSLCRKGFSFQKKPQKRKRLTECSQFSKKVNKQVVNWAIDFQYMEVYPSG